MANSTKFTILLVVCVLVSGCAGVGPGLEDAAEEAEEQANEDGGDSSDDQQAASSDDWCPEGQSTQYANPDTGQQVSLEFEGIVEREGREVCKAVWATDDPDGEVARMEMYFSEDDSYQEIITYDAEGNVVNEMRASGSGGSAVSGGGDGEWCADRSVQVNNPQTGEQASMEVEGIVERDGREVCHYVWETDDPDGEVARMEMYVNEDETYRETIYYDAEGEVVFEQVQTPDE